MVSLSKENFKRYQISTHSDIFEFSNTQNEKSDCTIRRAHCKKFNKTYVRIRFWKLKGYYQNEDAVLENKSLTEHSKIFC